MRHFLWACAAFMVLFTAASSAKAGAETVKESIQKAAFAGGCFWGMEKVFGELDGVVSTRVGYTGGNFKNPSYEIVCTGITGHAEAVEITYDSSRICYEDLLEFFFTHHDSTTLNRQGNDVGTQYRSAIFYYNDAQKEAAMRAKEALDKSGIFKSKVVTEIRPAGEFYAAEEYHQKYLQKNPHGYCAVQLQSGRISEVLKTVKT